MDAVSVKTVVELNMNWFKQNPELGVKAITDFYAQHPHTTWVTRAEQTKTNYLYLVAVLRGSGATADVEL